MSQVRVLAVDDQLYFRVFLEDLLHEVGYAVETVSSGQDALTRLEADSFDVVITDLVMPEMPGTELVQRIQERWPDQDIIVVTSVGDVKTAVAAMKLGAREYLLKPLDRDALVRTLDQLLEQRRLREEHRELVAENLGYLSIFTQYERALGLFSTLSIEGLGDRIVETFCLETDAHGGVVWLLRSGDFAPLGIAGVGGLVRVEDEPPSLDPQQLPDALTPLGLERAGALLVEGKGPEEHTSLYVPLRREGRLVGVIHLTDKLDGGAFGQEEIEIVDRLAPFAAQAVMNALAFGGLERQSFRDTTSGAYTAAYLQDVVANEVQKARRFGRTFSLIRIELDQATRLRESLDAADWTRLVRDVGRELGVSLRGTDLLALDGDARFCALLPEADAISSALAKRRLLSAANRSRTLFELSPDALLLAARATYPADGEQLDELWARLDERIAEDRSSLLRAHDLGDVPFRGLVDALLADAPTARAETAAQMTRYLLGELRRRQGDRGYLYVAPGEALIGPLRDGLAELRDAAPRTEIVLVADRQADLQPSLPVTWVSPSRAGTDMPFLVYFGEGPPYALLREAGVEEHPVTYQTADPVVVEQLAFKLGNDLGIQIGE